MFKSLLHKVGDLTPKDKETITTIGINTKDDLGDTILHHACAIGNNSLVKDLIGLSADADIKNNKGETPLHKASSEINMEAVYALISISTPGIKDKSDKTPLHHLFEKYRGEFERRLINDYGSFREITILFDKVIDIASLLIVFGEDISAKDCNGITAFPLNFLTEVDKSEKDVLQEKLNSLLCKSDIKSKEEIKTLVISKQKEKETIKEIMKITYWKNIDDRCLRGLTLTNMNEYKKIESEVDKLLSKSDEVFSREGKILALTTIRSMANVILRDLSLIALCHRGSPRVWEITKSLRKTHESKLLENLASYAMRDWSKTPSRGENSMLTKLINAKKQFCKANSK